MAIIFINIMILILTFDFLIVYSYIHEKQTFNGIVFHIVHKINHYN